VAEPAKKGQALCPHFVRIERLVSGICRLGPLIRHPRYFFVGAGFAAMVAQLLAAVSQLLALILGVVHARKLLS
jgi:hypothetical protein